jgi:serine/threonine protein phosphatase PrpC
MTITLRYAARSDRGLIRDGNQDSVYAGPRLLAVADGMGGMAAGDVASNIVIAAMAPLDEDVPGDAMIDALRSSVDAANQQLRAAVEANPQMEGMGTTLTALLFSGSRAGLVHIGDSRAYLLRDGEFTQITKDDTYVQMLVDEGRISPEEANSHPQRSLLTRAMDGRDIEPEYSIRQVLPGDRYLICSDGLSGVVSQETIEQTLRDYPDPQQCVERLISLALRGGGPDNITVIVADASDADIVEEAPVVGGAAAREVPAEPAHESTPAARASALHQPRPPVPPSDASSSAAEDEEEAPRPPRRPLRNALLLLVVLALVAGGLWYGWSYTQSSYYVGATEDGQVAVFRGLPGRIAGQDLSTLHLASDTDVADLTAVAQERVRRGIDAGSAEEAELLMNQLIQEHLKPLCPPSPEASPSASPAASPSASPDRSSVRGQAASAQASAEQRAEESTEPSPDDAGDRRRQPSGDEPSGPAVASPTVIPETPRSYDPADCRTE